ncbi:hypothetical protein SAMN05443428_103148 [Caloramator quimbayensis]|uniref:Uncharacterized protein n=1 Tax=Caloramator quimbayensis TaxID=1147123 RepID=A0A1T4WTP9_9CLOT|nr:hypothetical protein [Caloramator quimbayensis]SKA79991.1 hypothetical protein SAMN05443428_103148 [Caloramator quimbayensis]
MKSKEEIRRMINEIDSQIHQNEVEINNIRRTWEGIDASSSERILQANDEIMHLENQRQVLSWMLEDKTQGTTF